MLIMTMPIRLTQVSPVGHNPRVITKARKDESTKEIGLPGLIRGRAGVNQVLNHNHLLKMATLPNLINAALSRGFTVAQVIMLRLILHLTDYLKSP